MVEHSTSAQAMISQLGSSSPVAGSVPTARSPEPASDSVPVSLCPSSARTLSLSHSKINIKKKTKKIKEGQGELFPPLQLLLGLSTVWAITNLLI